MKISVKLAFLIVYIAISVSTFYHTAWGFGTLDGLPENKTGMGLVWWWTLGCLGSFAVDIGMMAIVYSILSGWNNNWLKLTLFILAFFSAYSQLIYSAYHADDIIAKTGNLHLNFFMQTILNLRIFILPIALPAFSLVYAFAGKYEPKEEFTFSKKAYGLYFYYNGKNNIIIHSPNHNNSQALCGQKNPDDQQLTLLYETDHQIKEIDCKNCKRLLSKKKLEKNI
jgi:hypothetical protein